MTDFALQTVAGATIVALDWGPEYPWPQWYESNIAVGRSLGKVARASERGPSLLCQRLTCGALTPLAASQLKNALREYSGEAQPLLLWVGGRFAIVADGTHLADGTAVATGTLRCRIRGTPEVVWVDVGTYTVVLELVQDLEEA